MTATDGDQLVEQPDTLTWWRAYGVPVMAIGEDGDWLALGHVEPRRMVAAMLKAARGQLRLDLDRDEVFGIGYHPDTADVAEILSLVRHSRGVFTIPAGCDPQYEWVVRYDADEPDAVPVTVWRT